MSPLTPPTVPTRPSLGVLFVRYGIGLILILVGIVLLILNPSGNGADGFGLCDGAGLSVLMLNFLFRLGIAGDKEREREEDARRYLAEHGYWPDDRRARGTKSPTPPPPASGPAPDGARTGDPHRHAPVAGGGDAHRRGTANPRRGPRAPRRRGSQG